MAGPTTEDDERKLNSDVHRTSLPEFSSQLRTLKDWTKVHSRMRMVSPCLSSLRRRAALKSLRQLKLMKLFYSTEGEKSQPDRMRKQVAKPPLDRTPKQRAEEREHEDGQTEPTANNSGSTSINETEEKSEKRPKEEEEQKKGNQNSEPKGRHPIW